MSDTEDIVSFDHSGFASEYVATIKKLPEKINVLAALEQIKSYNFTLYEVSWNVTLYGFISLHTCIGTFSKVSCLL